MPAFRNLPVIVFEQSFMADWDKSAIGEEVTDLKNLTAASAKKKTKSAPAVLGRCRCKSGSTAC